jgi:hypothetical protein
MLSLKDAAAATTTTAVELSHKDAVLKEQTLQLKEQAQLSEQQVQQQVSSARAHALQVVQQHRRRSTSPAHRSTFTFSTTSSTSSS